MNNLNSQMNGKSQSFQVQLRKSTFLEEEVRFSKVQVDNFEKTIADQESELEDLRKLL